MSFRSIIQRLFAKRDAPAPSPAPPSPTPPSPEEFFSTEVQAVLHEVPSVSSVTVKAADFSLVVVHAGQEYRMFLGNLFAETRELSPEDRAARIRRFVSSIREPAAADVPWEEAQERLVPVLRPCTIFAGIIDDPAKEPIRRPFAPFWIETVARDAEGSFQYVAPAVADGWGLPQEFIFEAARKTAAACFLDDDVAPYDSQAPYKIWYVARDDNYETSRLLLPGWLASFRDKVRGRPVAIVPARALLIVGGDGDEACLRRLIETAQREYQTAPRRLSPALYTVDDQDAVVPLVLPKAHPLANEVELGHVLMASSEYETQQTILQEKVGKDIFVASYTGIRRDDGTVTSYTTWVRGIDSLLPQAHEIALLVEPENESSKVLRVPWAEVVALVGDCLVPEPGVDPPRWRTVRWPDDAVIKKLHALALG